MKKRLHFKKGRGILLLALLLLSSCRADDGTPPRSTEQGFSVVTPPAVQGTPELTHPTPLPADASPTAPRPSPTPTPAVGEMPIPTPSGLPTEIYTVRSGDTFGYIAYLFDIDVDELAELNGIEDPGSIQAGQAIQIPIRTDMVGPSGWLIPDSELVYGPAYVDFDVEAFVGAQGGYLSTYNQAVNGVDMSGAEIVELIGQHFSVGPRVLLALLEYKAGWVTQPYPTNGLPALPFGQTNYGQAELYQQLAWAADRLNEGYYNYKQTGTHAFQFRDRSYALVGAALNGGTVGVQNALAAMTDPESWQQDIGPNGFIMTYGALFGDPFSYAVTPLIPETLQQPELFLPWPGGETWYYSGGPHGAWLEGAARTAVDFAPPDVMGHCGMSAHWVTAPADGLVIRTEPGVLVLDLDGDGHEQTGWVLFFLHVAEYERAEVGQKLKRGDKIGHPSCEGGMSESSHVHVTRIYNGQWMAADGPVPFVLSGWRILNGSAPYEGYMQKGDETREACECWDEQVNGVVSDNLTLP